MIIRKLFKFENAHIVRNCMSDRCKYSIHGHSYKVEVIIESNFLDNGHMVMDFGLLKGDIKRVIDNFDHAITLWDKDDIDYINSMKQYSKRWITLPVSPSAEQFSRVFFVLIDDILKKMDFKNNEKNVELKSIIVHETDTGYAQCFKDDITNKDMGIIDINKIVFSPDILK